MPAQVQQTSSYQAKKRKLDCRTEVASDCSDTLPDVNEKKRFAWSADLHREFVGAVFEIGLRESAPKLLLELMAPTQGLNAHHLKSHLQKYRQYKQRSSSEGGAGGSASGLSVDYSTDLWVTEKQHQPQQVPSSPTALGHKPPNQVPESAMSQGVQGKAALMRYVQGLTSGLRRTTEHCREQVVQNCRLLQEVQSVLAEAHRQCPESEQPIPRSTPSPLQPVACLLPAPSARAQGSWCLPTRSPDPTPPSFSAHNSSNPPPALRHTGLHSHPARRPSATSQDLPHPRQRFSTSSSPMQSAELGGPPIYTPAAAQWQSENPAPPHFRRPSGYTPAASLPQRRSFSTAQSAPVSAPQPAGGSLQANIFGSSEDIYAHGAGPRGASPGLLMAVGRRPSDLNTAECRAEVDLTMSLHDRIQHERLQQQSSGLQAGRDSPGAAVVLRHGPRVGPAGDLASFAGMPSLGSRSGMGPVRGGARGLGSPGDPRGFLSERRQSSGSLRPEALASWEGRGASSPAQRREHGSSFNAMRCASGSGSPRGSFDWLSETGDPHAVQPLSDAHTNGVRLASHDQLPRRVGSLQALLLSGPPLEDEFFEFLVDDQDILMEGSGDAGWSPGR